MEGFSTPNGGRKVTVLQTKQTATGPVTGHVYRALVTATEAALHSATAQP